MKRLILVLFLCSVLFPRELFLNTNEALSVKSSNHSHGINIDYENNLTTNTTI